MFMKKIYSAMCLILKRDKVTLCWLLSWSVCQLQFFFIISGLQAATMLYNIYLTMIVFFVSLSISCLLYTFIPFCLPLPLLLFFLFLVLYFSVLVLFLVYLYIFGESKTFKTSRTCNSQWIGLCFRRFLCLIYIATSSSSFSSSTSSISALPLPFPLPLLLLHLN